MQEAHQNVGLLWLATRFAPTVVLVGHLVGSACGGGAEASIEQQPTAGPSGRTFASIQVPDDRLDDALSQASEPERRLLEDGVLTFAEYEGVTLAAVNCLATAGIGVISPPHLTSPPRKGLVLVGRGQYRYSPDLDETSFTPQRGAIAGACLSSNAAVVQALWIEFTSPSLAEIEEARLKVSQCLINEGYDVPLRPAKRDLDNVAFPPDGIARGRQMDPGYRGCIEPVIEEYGLHVAGAAF